MTNNITFLQFVLLIFYAAMMGASQILMSKAAHQIANEIKLIGLVSGVLISYWLYFAIAFYILATVVWLFILTKINIKIAYPVAISSVVFASIFESVRESKFPGFQYWIGLMLVLCGIFLVINHSE